MTRAIENKAIAYERLCEEATKLGKRKKIEKRAALYENLFGFREMPKYMVVILIGRLHDIAMTIGEEFVSEGSLEKADQIFDLHTHEITRGQQNRKLDLMVLAKENLVPYEKMKDVKQWPVNIDSRGKIFYPKRKEKEGEWMGQAISRGLVRGKAKVLATPYEKPLEAGEILVTHSAEPAWTPIFINASGVVLEVGGVLQHGAIIAREYGIPCVSGVQGITQRIIDGDILEVDGTNGVVRMIT